MTFWAALGQVFLLLFEPPVISFESLRNHNWKKQWTVKNVYFGLFWGMVLSIATSYGVWSKLGKYLVDDAYNFCENAPWTCHHLWLIHTFIVLLAGSGLAVGYLSTSRPQEFELLNKVFRSASFYVKSACEVKIIAQIVKAVPIFWKQLRMNLFLSRMTGDDGEIMGIQGSEEKPESKKTKTKLGVPKFIRDQKKQAIESAQAVVNKTNGNGSVGKAAGPMNKK